MHAVAHVNPFDPKGHILIDVAPGQTLAEVVRHERLPRHYHEHARVKICRRNSARWVEYDRSLWPHTRIKDGTLIVLQPDIEGGKVGRIVGALATVALAFATGGLAAGLLAGVGVGAQLLGGLLTPKPERPKQAAKQEPLSQAGISINDIRRGETVPAVIGRIAYAPDHLVPPYVTLEKAKVWSHAMVGCHGRCLIEDVRINDVPWADVPGAVVETFEGSGGEGDSILSENTYFMDPIARAMKIGNFTLSVVDTEETQLKDQLTPDNSLPPWQHFFTNGIADEATIRLAFPSSITSTAGAEHAVALRIEIRERGTETWKKLPVVHIRDIKQQGGFRADIRLRWGFDGAQWLNAYDSYNAFAAYMRTASGQPFEYEAEAYFDPAGLANSNLAPTMTSNSTGGVTTSASANNTDAWLASDNNTSTEWEITVGDLPAWWKIDFGAGNEQTLRRIRFTPVSLAVDGRPSHFKWSASNDDVTYVDMVEGDERGEPIMQPPYNFRNDTAYRYWKLDIYASHHATVVALPAMFFYDNNATANGNQTNALVGTNLANYVRTREDGCDIYLDPNQGWTRGEYEIRVQRSIAFAYASLTYSDTVYQYAGASSGAWFFTYSTSSPYTARLRQDDINSDMTVDEFITGLYERPIAASVEPFLARIVARAPDIVINSISATFTRYAREWNGATWVDTMVPTRNPASHWRDALLFEQNTATPLPGEILDEASLEAFYDHCETNGFTCDTVVRDRSVADVLALLGACSRTSPRQSDLWGVVIDQDRSGDPLTELLTPETSRDEGATITYERVPHGLRVSYLDEDDNFIEKETEVYRAGFSAETATDIEAVQYDGITSLAKATAQAEYDLGQLYHRNIEFTRTVGIEGRFLARGQKIGIADEVIGRHCYWGLVKRLITSGSNVTGLELYGTAKLSGSLSDIGMSGDISGISDFSTFTGSFGACVRMKDGTTITAAISDTADTETITFTSPVDNTAGLFATMQPVGIGPLGREVIPVILRHKVPIGDEQWRLTLVPEANEIFA